MECILFSPHYLGNHCVVERRGCRKCWDQDEIKWPNENAKLNSKNRKNIEFLKTITQRFLKTLEQQFLYSWRSFQDVKMILAVQGHLEGCIDHAARDPSSSRTPCRLHRPCCAWQENTQQSLPGIRGPPLHPLKPDSVDILHRSGPDKTTGCISVSSQEPEELSLQFQTGCGKKLGTELLGWRGEAACLGKGSPSPRIYGISKKTENKIMELCTQEAQTSEHYSRDIFVYMVMW